jgi:hypothetical protein
MCCGWLAVQAFSPRILRLMMYADSPLGPLLLFFACVRGLYVSSGGFFFGSKEGAVARKGLPADPDMEEMFTTLFVEFDKEIQEQRFLETVNRNNVLPGCVLLCCKPQEEGMPCSLMGWASGNGVRTQGKCMNELVCY